VRITEPTGPSAPVIAHRGEKAPVLDMNQSENIVPAGGGLLFAAKVLARDAQQPAFRNGLSKIGYVKGKP